MKKLSLVFAAAAMTATLTACPGTRVPEVPQPSELKGPVSLLKVSSDSKVEKAAWNLGEKTVALTVINEKTGEEKAPFPTPVAKGTVKADGQFSLKLPEKVDASLLSGSLWANEDSWKKMLGEECKGAKPVMSDPAAQAGVGVLLVENEVESVLLAGPQPVLTFENLKLSGSGQAGTVMYVDRATTVRGTVTCTYNTSAQTETAHNFKATYNVDLKLKPGWNSVVVSAQGRGERQDNTSHLIGGEATLNLISKNLPSEWMMPVPVQGSAVPLSLSKLLN